jgi:hypothetical protein
MKSKAQMTKKDEEEWNDGHWNTGLKKNSPILLHYSIIPLFHYSTIIPLNFGRFDVHLIPLLAGDFEI